MKFLTFNPQARLTPAITRAAECMDKFFEGEASIISSGLRGPIDQLKIIRDKAQEWGFLGEFPEMIDCEGCGVEHTVHISDLNRDLFYWQRTWSKLLNVGYVVNPPVPAEVLFDYFRPGNPKNKKGEIIMISPHQRGLALDISGGDNLLEKAKRVMKAFQSGEAFISDFLVENINVSIHVGVKQIG